MESRILGAHQGKLELDRLWRSFRLALAILAHERAFRRPATKRVAIASAIITDPTLIVADEPTGDLARVSAEEILGLLNLAHFVVAACRVMLQSQVGSPKLRFMHHVHILLS
jgi:ABC-type Na+ transport system ATPase subunit NatA